MRIERMALPEPGEVHVWRVELPTADGREAARRALREILAAYLGEEPGLPAPGAGEAVEPAASAIVVGERGKPRLAGSPPPLSFNLSHSGGLALVAVAAGGAEVGVDIERLRPRRDLVRLAARWLPEADAAAVAAADEVGREEVFYAAWTRHEARAKCTGAGLSGPPPGPEIVAQELEIDAGYAAALASDLRPPLRVRRMDT
jgi:4'-phosphopantetheinyl transferase